MPRTMAFDIDVEVPARQMYQFFTGIDYWRDLVEHYRENSVRTEIAHFGTDADGTDVSFAHIMTSADLPAPARPVMPAEFAVTRVQHFDPFRPDTNTAAGRYRAEIPVAPAEVSGSYLLFDSASGSRMRMETLCQVRVPIIGGQIEGLILAGLKTLFAKEGEFTADWVAGHR